MKKDIAIAAIRDSASVPSSLRDKADHIVAAKLSRFDDSYIEFLDTQIRLGSRGKEWSKRLARRRKLLLPFCNRDLLSVHVAFDETIYWLKIDPETKKVVFWEEDKGRWPAKNQIQRTSRKPRRR